MQIILTLTVGILLYLSGAFLARYLRFLINISAKQETYRNTLPQVNMDNLKASETSVLDTLTLDIAELKAKILDVENRVLKIQRPAPGDTVLPPVSGYEPAHFEAADQAAYSELKLLEFPPEADFSISDPETTISEAEESTDQSTTPEPTTPVVQNGENWTFDTPAPRSGTPMTELDSSSQSSYSTSPKREALEDTKGGAPSTVPLTKLPLFQPRLSITRGEAFNLSYQRAQALNKHYGLTVDDIMDLSPKFFDMHRDDIIIRDIGSHALLGIQHNLAAGTIAPYAKDSPRLQELLDKVLNFEVS